MRAVVQRVVKAKVFHNNRLINEISDGLLVYIGFTQSDNQIIADKMIRKIMNLRIFNDSNDKLNENILTVNGKILFISQFTLYGDVNRSNRPSFTHALNGEKAEPLYNYMLERFNHFIPTYGGVFGGQMEIESINDGPVTILIEY